MSDRNRPHANGRSDPAGLPAGKLAAWWDRRSAERRTGSSDTPADRPVAVVAQLEALARADEMSAPRPGFLDELERQIMQTPTAVVPIPITTRHPQPSPTTLVGRPSRQGRGLVDILTVAAVLALLLGGSWSVLNDRADAPTPGGQNGVAGVSTPDEAATSTPEGNRIVALNQPWVETLPDVAINGVLPVSTSACVTPSRPPGSVEASVRERRALGDAAPTFEPMFVSGAQINSSRLPPGSDADVEAMTAFFRQLSACRFETGERNGTQLLPYTGAYWNLYADEAFGFDGATQVDRDVDEVVREQYFFQSTYVHGWSYPATVLDVRQVWPDDEGRPRLLVTTNGSNPGAGAITRITSLMVQEDGQWRFLIPDTAPGDYGRPVAAFVADVLLGRDSHGPQGPGNWNNQLEANFPVAMTIANVGETPQQVSVAGQDLGIVAPGEAILVQPFRIRLDAIEEGEDYFTFTVESLDLEAAPDAPDARPMTIAVYRAESLPYAPEEAGRATPAVSDAAGTSPLATPESTPVSVTEADQVSHVADLV